MVLLMCITTRRSLMYITTRSRRKLVAEHQFGCNSCDPEQKRYTRLLFSSPEDFWTTFSTEVAEGSLKAPERLSFKDSSELKLGKRIAQGGEGYIFRAEWKLGGENLEPLPVVVKVFKPRRGNWSELERTITALKKLNPQSNPRDEICEIREFSIIETERAIVMERMVDNLRNFIDFHLSNMNLMNTDMNLQMLFPYDTSIAMMMSVAKGVRDLHSCRLLHKDLKSTNVLLAPNKGWMDSGFMKIADFEMGGAAGTGFWRAPEVLRAVKDGVRPILTQETYVYGFAMLCYEIFTGYFPFQGEMIQKKAMGCTRVGVQPCLFP